MSFYAKTLKKPSIRVENPFSHAIAVYYYHGGMCLETEPLYRKVIAEPYGHETGLLFEKRPGCKAHLDIT